MRRLMSLNNDEMIIFHRGLITPLRFHSICKWIQKEVEWSARVKNIDREIGIFFKTDTKNLHNHTTHGPWWYLFWCCPQFIRFSFAETLLDLMARWRDNIRLLEGLLEGGFYILGSLGIVLYEGSLWFILSGLFYILSGFCGMWFKTQ